MKFICFLIVVLLSVQPAYGQSISGRKKSAFIDHINNFLNKLVVATNDSSATTPRPPPAGINIPVGPAVAPTQRTSTMLALRPGENPALALTGLQNSLVAINLQEAIAAPAVRPCFIRPAFCPATSDACSNSRCARLYANGVRIGSRFYKRVKCRLNYCRETCGKAEWYADGRRLIGCSDSTSTLDDPIWSVQRVFPRPARPDTRVFPIERVASPRSPLDDATTMRQPSSQQNPMMLRVTPSTWSLRSGQQPQRRSVSFIGDIGGEDAESVLNKTQEFGQRIKQKFERLGVVLTQQNTWNADNSTMLDNSSFAYEPNNGIVVNGTVLDGIVNEVQNATYNLVPLADQQDPNVNATATKSSRASTTKAASAVVIFLWPVFLFLVVAFL